MRRRDERSLNAAVFGWQEIIGNGKMKKISPTSKCNTVATQLCQLIPADMLFDVDMIEVLLQFLRFQSLVSFSSIFFFFFYSLLVECTHLELSNSRRQNPVNHSCRNREDVDRIRR